jgi:hypothetical protein
VFIRRVSLVPLYGRLYLLVWSVLGRSFHSYTCLTPTNASDDDFVHDEEYQKEFNEETRLEKNEGLAVDKDQADTFGNDLQQLVQDPTDRPALKNTRLRPRINGRVVALSHEIQECGSVKKKEKKKESSVSFNNVIPTESEQEVEDIETHFFDAISDHPSKPVPKTDPDPDPSPNPDPGVGVNVDDDSSPNSGVNDNEPAGLDNSFNPDGCWGINSFHVMAPILAPLLGVLFLRGHIFLKNRTYSPLFRQSATPFQRTCLLTRLKEDPDALYCSNGWWYKPVPTAFWKSNQFE